MNPLLVILHLLTTGLSVIPMTNSHEMHLYPAVVAAPLGLEGWLVPPGADYQIHVLVPPSFGTLVGEDYRPAPEFWQAGADRVSIAIETFGPSQISRHTFLFSPLRLTAQEFEAIADFESESGAWPPGWTEEDPDDLIEIVDGDPAFAGKSVVATVSRALATGSVGPTEHHGGGSTGYGGAGGSQVGPPPDPLMDPGTVVVAALGEIEVQADLHVEPVTGERYYRMRAAVPNRAATPWHRVPSETLIHFNVWAGSKVIGPGNDPLLDPWGVRLVLEPTGQAPATYWLDGLFDAVNLRLGVLDPAPAGMTDFNVGYDDVVTWTELHDHTPLGHLADGFEDGNADGWESVGPVDVLHAAALGGDWGLAIDVDSLVTAGGIEDAVLIDTSPSAQTSATVFLRVDLASLTLGEGDSLQLLRGSSADLLDAGLHLSLVLSRHEGRYRLRVRVRDDQDVTHKTPWFELAGDRHDIAVLWRASSAAGALDGEARFWVNGVAAGEKLGLDNDSRVLEALAFGAHRSILNGAGPLGKIHLDDLASFR